MRIAGKAGLIVLLGCCLVPPFVGCCCCGRPCRRPVCPPAGYYANDCSGGVSCVSRSTGPSGCQPYVGVEACGPCPVGKCRPLSSLRPTPEPIAQDHSRFHPVPTRPVFCSRYAYFADAVESSSPGAVIPVPAAESVPSGDTPPAPPPAEVPSLTPGSARDDRATAAPRRLAGLSRLQRTPSWIFSAPTPYADPPGCSVASAPQSLADTATRGVAR